MRIKFGMKAWSMLAAMLFSIVVISGCNDETTSPAPTPGPSPASTAGKAPEKKPETAAPTPPPPTKPDEKEKK